MKSLNRFALLAAAALALSSAAIAADAPPPPQLPRCDAPVATIMVGKMACKAANCNSGQQSNSNGLAALLQAVNQANSNAVGSITGIADGIKDVLVTALAESGCFDVQDREQMDELQAELARAGKQVQTVESDFLVSGAVTQIDVSSEKTQLGGGIIPIIGMFGKKTNTAAVSLDMKLVKVSSAKVVASKRATASSETSSYTFGGGGIGTIGGGIGGFGGSFSSLKGTNLEAVTKDAIVQSVTFLVEAARAAKSGAPAVTAAAAPTVVAQ